MSKFNVCAHHLYRLLQIGVLAFALYPLEKVKASFFYPLTGLIFAAFACALIGGVWLYRHDRSACRAQLAKCMATTFTDFVIIAVGCAVAYAMDDALLYFWLCLLGAELLLLPLAKKTTL